MRPFLSLSLCFALLLLACDDALRFDEQFPAETKKQILQDLGHLRGVQGGRAPPLHKKIFGSELDGITYLNFFRKRIKSVGVNECGGAMACVLGRYDASKMWISQDYVRLHVPEVLRLASLLHEARHADKKNDYWLHDECPTPFVDELRLPVRGIVTGRLLEGLRACDQHVLGAYGIEVIFLHNLARGCSNCSEKFRMDALLYARDSRKRLLGEAQKLMNRDWAFYPDKANTSPR